MIASLRGELLQKATDRVVINVSGVGYEVLLSANSLDRLPAVGDPVFLHIHTHVREDAITLFGFGDTEEKTMFLLLITVTGIGPKLGLAILSGIRPAPLARAVAEKNIALLTGLSGVGKKTAERLCLDLKDKVGFVSDDGDGLGGGAGATAVTVSEGINADVVSALINLGYQQTMALQAIAAVKARLSPDEFNGLQLQDLLRQTLRAMT